MASVSPSPNSTPTSSPSPPPPLIPPPQTNANPPDSSAPPPPSPPPNAPPPSTPATPPPISSTTPPTPSANPPPPTPTTSPPVSSPPPPVVPPPANPPTPTPANPPALSPPLPTTPPPSSSLPPTTSPPPPSTPPISSPTPPSVTPPTSPPPSPPLPNPPANSSPPPPEASPSPPASSSPPSSPPRISPSPPAASPPRGSSTPPSRDSPPPSDPVPVSPPSTTPGPPAASPPRGSLTPPSSDSPPPSDPVPASPPSTTPGPPALGPPLSPPPPGSETIVPSTPNLPANRSSRDAPATANAPSQGGLGAGGAVAIGVIAGLLMLGLIGLLGVWMYKRKKKSSGSYDGHVIPASIGSSPRSDGKLLVRSEYPGSTFEGGSGTDTPTDHGGYGHSKSWFTYQELYDATSGFSDEKLLGEGGFGLVHKGLLTDGRVVAVKQLKIGGGQGEREFKAEVEIISRIHHRHLVSLVGYCIWENKRLLVYEYVPNNTLHFHLYGEGRPVMDWATRVKIAVGAARGITYLHEDCHPRIIHRDIKSSNILLDNNFESRVADFGLAKLAMDAETHVSTRVMGTFGYMAPEYATTGKLTEKSDVYSFGVVLLELITGRKPVDESQPLGDESLVEWARPLLSHVLDTGEFEGLVDPRLEKNYIESEMFRMIEAAAACVRHSAVRRPRMGLVVRALTMSDSGDLSNGLRVGESQLYDSAQQSAEIRWFRRMAFGSQDLSSDFFNSTQNIGPSGASRQGDDISTQHQHNRNSLNVSSQNQSWNSGKFPADRQLMQHNQGYMNQSFNKENSGDN